MKKKLYLLTALLLAFGFSANAQKQSMTVHKTDGTSVTYKSSEVLRIEFVDGTGAGTGTGTGTGEGDNPGTGGGTTGETGSIDGHDYVDLGLPSGTLWATCNVGATTPEGFGETFRWGETIPTDEYTSENYFDTGYVKYRTVGGYASLLPEDDAATANWGNNWCLPSYEQITELLDNCTQENVIKNSVKCICLKSKNNGNLLYFPLSGSGHEMGWAASYHSNSLSNFSDEMARALAITQLSDGYFLLTSTFNDRLLPQSARAVVKQ